MANQKSGERRQSGEDHGEGGRYVCSKGRCDKRAEEVVALKIYWEDKPIPAEVFCTIFACSEEHKAPIGDIRKFFEDNWETLATGFELHGLPRPVLERTEMAWVPIEEYEEHKRRHAADDPASKRIVSIN